MKTPTNIWDLAIDQSRDKRANISSNKNESESSERSLLILGSKGVGKTTLIHRFLDSSDAAKSTLALEYTFGRKTNNNLAKDVCHIWELGGGTLFTKLLETPLSPLKLPQLHVVLMIDLSKPEELWFTLETLVTNLQTHLDIILKSAEATEHKIEEKLIKLTKMQMDAEHPDKDLIKPLLLPCIILGSKYDEFQNLDPEKKKIICKALRFFAHFHGASLQFYRYESQISLNAKYSKLVTQPINHCPKRSMYAFFVSSISAMDSGLVRKAKEILNYHAFGSDPVKGVSQDYNKPLFIPAYSDSMQAILGQSTDHGRITLDMWKHQYTTHFPQTVEFLLHFTSQVF